MKRCTLTEPYERFLNETAWLLSSFEIALVDIQAMPIDAKLAQLGAEMAVIRLYDAWARFCRELVILSAGCRPYTYSGSRLDLAPNISCRSDVIPRLVKPHRKRSYEPEWPKTIECLDAAQHLTIPNFGTVSAALGATISPIEEIRNVRNFFAHRGYRTVRGIQGQSFHTPITRYKVEDLAGQMLPPGVTRMEFWILQLRLVAYAAIQ